MQDAHYLRSQAALCLQMAQTVSNTNIAAKYRAAAADYFSRAADAESSNARTQRRTDE